MKKKHYLVSEASRISGVSETRILYYIQQEWVLIPERETMELDEEDLARARLISELQEELGANDAAVPIILHLVDQLNWLRSRFSQNDKNYSDQEDHK